MYAALCNQLCPIGRAGGPWRVRHELKALVASYDSSPLQVSVLNALVDAGFAEIASAIAAKSTSPDLTPAHKAVFVAAAGNWEPLVDLVMQVGVTEGCPGRVHLAL